MSTNVVRVSPDWLALREPADAEARARDLVEAFERASPPGGSRVIHDLGCGTGSMGRWLAPLLAGPQHWVLHDRDADLLARATADAPGAAADGAPVTVEARRTDLDHMGARDLTGATLVTASALLDMLTAEELDRLAGLCLGAGCPILLTLSVIGSVEITPSEPLDRRVAAAFDAHQRRTTERGALLGPDAADFAAQAFRRLGAEVLVSPSPWRLGARALRPGRRVVHRLGRCRPRTGARAGRRVRALRPPAPRASQRREPRRHRRPRRPPRPPLMSSGPKTH